jgi:general secretion pathway protein H
MPISATGIWISDFRQGGFTLLELMVTMVLIGIIATFAVLSLRGSSDTERLASEARRLAALIDLNHQEAILLGEQRGVHFTETGYSFLNLVGKDWLPSTSSTLLRQYQLPPGLMLKLWVENRRIRFADTPSAIPQLVLLSSGETTAFQIIFSIEDSTAHPYNVTGDVMGNLHYGPVL